MKKLKNKKILLIIFLLIFISVFIYFYTVYYEKSHITKVVKINNIADENSTINGFQYGYSNPVIPKGFKTSNEGAEWKTVFGEIKGWNNGLVIEDEKGNQFVWVPVKDGIEEDGIYTDNETLKYKKWCMYGENKKENIGRKYLYVSPDQIKDLELPKGINSETEQIEKYGGFYIGRYETGMSEQDVKRIYNLQDGYETFVADKKNDTTEATPIIKENTILWNLISFKNLKVVCENMYSNEQVQSGVMTDRQFDTIMRWAYLSGYDLEDGAKWGNFLNTHDEEYTGKHVTYFNGREIGWKMEGYGVKENDNIVITSPGGVKRAKMNEIYDIVGNLFEYVNSKYENIPKSAINRGGSAGYYGVLGDKGYSTISYNDTGETTIHYIMGFRVTLFVK